MNERWMKNQWAKEQKRDREYLAKSACREGRFAGFQMIKDERPEHLRVSEAEFQTWKEGWERTEREAEEAKRTTATIVWISWIYYGEPKEVYGVISGCHPTDNEQAEVTLWAPPHGKTVYVPYRYLETQDTMSVRDRWDPPEEILMLSNATGRGPAHLRWDQVLARTDLIGGDLESVEDGVAYRGPIKSMEIQNGQVIIEGEWTARINPENGEWELWHINRLTVNAEHTVPQNISDGRIHFNMLMLGYATIFPKGGSKLDPARVKGLSVAA